MSSFLLELEVIKTNGGIKPNRLKYTIFYVVYGIWKRVHNCIILLIVIFIYIEYVYEIENVFNNCNLCIYKLRFLFINLKLFKL